jgi:hypothetical protein
MLKACLVGAAVAFGLTTIPIVHFFTGPPAPFIGGYIAGSRAAATPGTALLIGGILAVALALPAGGLFLALALILGYGAVFVLIGVAVFAIWCAMLGSLGAIIGGSSVRRQASES